MWLRRLRAPRLDEELEPAWREGCLRESQAALEGFLSWQPYTLPEPVRVRTLELMDILGLNYGALDFIVTPEGRHVFLEVNPAGEFMWLMRSPGLPIAEALADVLSGRVARRRSEAAGHSQRSAVLGDA